MSSIRMAVILFAACGTASLRADTHYVAHNGQTETPPYTNDWAAAASNIQHAVNAAVAGDTVLVGPGRYTVPTNAVVSDGGTNVVYLNKLLTVRSFSGTPEDTIIDGGGSNRGIAVYHPANSSLYRFVLDGLTVSNCFAGPGGGINLSPNTTMWTSVVQNCVICNSTSTGGRGIVYVYNSWNLQPWTLIVSNSVIRNNTGAGVYTYPYFGEKGGVRMTDCLIENNMGGGLDFWRGSNVVRNCVIRNNTATTAGAGMYLAYGKHRFFNCLICNNSDTAAAPAITYSAYCTPEFYNCTIVSNRGRGLHAQTDSIKVWNSIVYSNTANFTLVVNFTNSCTYPTNSVTGPGNIASKPQFANFAARNFRLSLDSPCLNAGVNQDWMNGAVDLDGFRRVDRAFNRVDMGCYEYSFRLGTIITVD